MNLEFIERWASVLLEYMQGNNKLRDGDRFCCLGVACDLYMKETGEGYWDKGTAGFVLPNGKSADTLNNEIFLPASLAEFIFGNSYFSSGYINKGPLALSSYEAYVWHTDDGQTAISLVDANDGADFSFEQIKQLLLNLVNDAKEAGLG